MTNRARLAMTWIALGSCAMLIGLQFIRPSLANPGVAAEVQAPPEVRQILHNSCYNCHSNETKLSWYDKAVPAYWLVTSDVRNARSHVNFSEIGALPADQQKGVLFEAVNNIQLGAMPLPSYRAMHPHAAVSADDLAVLRAYLTAPQSPPSTSSMVNQSSGSSAKRAGAVFQGTTCPQWH